MKLAGSHDSLAVAGHSINIDAVVTDFDNNSTRYWAGQRSGVDGSRRYITFFSPPSSGVVRLHHWPPASTE